METVGMGGERGMEEEVEEVVEAVAGATPVGARLAGLTPEERPRPTA